MIALDAGDIVSGGIVGPVRHRLGRHDQPAVVKEDLIVSPVRTHRVMAAIGDVTAQVASAWHAQTLKPWRQGHVCTWRGRGRGRRCDQQATADGEVPDYHAGAPLGVCQPLRRVPCTAGAYRKGGLRSLVQVLNRCRSSASHARKRALLWSVPPGLGPAPAPSRRSSAAIGGSRVPGLVPIGRGERRARFQGRVDDAGLGGAGRRGKQPAGTNLNRAQDARPGGNRRELDRNLGGPHRLDRNRGDLREGPTAFPTSLSIRGVANRKYSYPSTLVNTFCCCCACDHVGNAKAEQSEAAVLSTWSQASPSKTARGVR